MYVPRTGGQEDIEDLHVRSKRPRAPENLSLDIDATGFRLSQSDLNMYVPRTGGPRAPENGPIRRCQMYFVILARHSCEASIPMVGCHNPTWLGHVHVR